MIERRAPWTQPALCVLVSAVVGGGCQGDPPARSEARGAAAASSGAAARRVVLVPVTEVALPETIEIAGTLAADEQATVGVKVPGRLVSVAVDLASPVQQGQAIAQIDPRDYELRVDQANAALAQARAELGLGPDESDSALDLENVAIVRQARATVNEAKTNLTRARALAEEGLTTGMQLDAAEANAVRAETALQSAVEEVRIRQATVRQRQSELRLARQQLADAVLRSPLDGIVQQRIANVGEYLAAGAPVALVVRIDPLRLRVSVPEREASRLSVGQTVEVRSEADGATYTGALARLAPSLDAQSRSLLVEADIKNPGQLRPGQFVRSRVILAAKPAVTVPKSAVVAFAGIHKVITVHQGKAVEKRVTIGRAAADRVEITSGVKLGDRVVAEPGSLQQGQPVSVQPGS